MTMIEQSSILFNHSDAILQSEIEKRDAEIEDLKNKYSAETKLRVKVEKKRDNLTERLVGALLETSLLQTH